MVFKKKAKKAEPTVKKVEKCVEHKDKDGNDCGRPDCAICGA